MNKSGITFPDQNTPCLEPNCGFRASLCPLFVRACVCVCVTTTEADPVKVNPTSQCRLLHRAATQPLLQTMPTTLQQSSSPTLDLDCAPSRSSSDEEGNEDEIDRYYNMKVGGNVDPVEWWISNKAQLLKLSQMALDVLAIPAMAADCERSFSIAKLTLSSQRHAMKWETIEMLQMLKNWLRNGDIVIGGVMMGSSPGWGSIKGQQGYE